MQPCPQLTKVIMSSPQEQIETVYGLYLEECRSRLELTYDYESATIKSFFDIASSIGTNKIVDIGANVGVYSIFLSGIETVTDVYAFEPAPEAYRLLKANAELQNSSVKFHCHAVAASDAPGVLKFNLITPTSGANSVVGSGKEEKEGGVIEVKAERIDDVVPLRGEKLAVKIDVEGHESNVISGMRSILCGNSCFLQVECLSEDKLTAIQGTLISYGYSALFSLRDDYFFVHKSLEGYKTQALEIIAKNLHDDLRDLLHLRRQKRKLSADAKKLWKQIGYKRDPLFLGRSENPF